ncbi:MAG: tetratricopeptide repeat protein [Bacteroidales bacterium]
MEESAKYLNINSLGIGDLERLVVGFPWFSYARQVLLYKLAQIGEECFDQKFRDYAAFLHSRELVYYKTRDILNGKTIIDITETHHINEDIIELPGAVNAVTSQKENVKNEKQVENYIQTEQKVEEDIESQLKEIKEEEILGEEIPEELEEQQESLEVLGNDEEAIDFDELNNVQFEGEVDSKPKVYILGGDYFSKNDFEQLKEEEPVEMVETLYTNQEPIMSIEDFDSPEFFTETLAKIYAEQGYYEQAIEVYAKLILLYPEKSTYFATLVDEIKSKN